MRSFALLPAVAAALWVIPVATLMAPSTSSVRAVGPVLTVSPSSGPPGQVVTVAGSGFADGEEVSVEVFPGTHRNGGTYLIGKVRAVKGEFRFNVTVWNVYPGLSAPEIAPPGGGQPLAYVVQGPWTLMAYPLSAGPRTQETVSAAPKAVFTVVAGFPEGGGPPSQGNTEAGIAIILFGAVLALAGIGLAGGPAVWRGRSRGSGRGRACQVIRLLAHSGYVQA